MKKDKIIIQEAIRMLREGITQDEIARRTGISQSTVSRVARRLGVSRGRGRRKGSRRKQKRGIWNVLQAAKAVLADPSADPAGLAEASGLRPKTVIRALTYMLPIARSALLACKPGQTAREAAAELARDAAGDREVAAALGVSDVLEAAGEKGTALILEAALARWQACAAGARGLANAIELSKYYRTAAGLLRILRRFLPADVQTRIAAARAAVDPAPLRHPTPRLGRVRVLYDPRDAKRAAQAQIRHELSGLAVAPGPQVLYAYYLLVTERVSPDRDCRIALNLMEAIKCVRVVSADLTTEDVVFDRFLEALRHDRDLPEKIKRHRNAAIAAAASEAFVLGRRRLRSRVRRNMLAFLGFTWSVLLQPGLPGEEPEAYRRRTEAETLAAGEFFSALEAQKLPPVGGQWPDPWPGEALAAPDGDLDAMVARRLLEPLETGPADELFLVAVAAAGGGRVFGRGAKAQAWDAKSRGSK